MRIINTVRSEDHGLPSDRQTHRSEDHGLPSDRQTHRKLIHSRPENLAIQGKDEKWPLSISLQEATGFSPWSFIVVLAFAFLLLPFSISCAKEKELSPEEYARQSEVYYQRAVSLYQDLIAQAKDTSKLHFALGQLYFQHGDFQKACVEFKKSDEPAAKKYLAITYYHLGDFTQALESFTKNTFLDDESRYYYGLTSEKLNLFDQALSIYRKIENKEFVLLARERINLIEKQCGLLKIKEISPQIFEFIKKSPLEKEYPQAGGLILLADEKIEITADYKEVSQMHYLIKILNERGKETFSEAQIDYDSTYEKVELEFARTIKPDGTVTEVGLSHIRDVSKYLNFPLYSNARVFIISFPEIAKGVCIEYKVKVYRNQLINQKDFVLNYPLQSPEPIIAADFAVTLPQERPLSLKVLNSQYNDFGANLTPEITKADQEITYRWQFRNIPQIIPESNMPPEVEINPTLILSTFKNWQEIFDWWWNLAKDQLKASDAIKKKVRELVEGKNSLEEKIRAIYNFCAKEIRYVAVEYGQAGYQPHQASDIFRNKYGDCKDQAVLLITMLKEAGVLAYPVLISTKDYYNLNEDFPSMLFNHVIAALSIAKEIVFMDPTAEVCSFGNLPGADQNRGVLIFKPEGYTIETTPLFSAASNLVRQKLYLNINHDESIVAEKSVFTYGSYDQFQRYWLLYTPPELISDSLKEKIQDFSIGAKLIGYEIKNLDDLNQPVVLKYSFSGPEYLSLAGRLRIMPQLVSLDTSVAAKDNRRYAIDFDILDSQEKVFEIAIPKDFVIKYIPESINEDSPWLKFQTQYSCQGNTLYIKEKRELKKNLIATDDYAGFKAFLEALAKKIKQRVVLEKPDE